MVYRLQLLGFNAVRLPFSFVDLYDTPPKSQTRSCPQVRLTIVTVSYEATGSGKPPMQVMPSCPRRAARPSYTLPKMCRPAQICSWHQAHIASLVAMAA